LPARDACRDAFDRLQASSHSDAFDRLQASSHSEAFDRWQASSHSEASNRWQASSHLSVILKDEDIVMSSTLFILNEAPYGSERSYNALRLAGALGAREGQEVRVF
jgi:hypothetical protein